MIGDALELESMRMEESLGGVDFDTLTFLFFGRCCGADFCCRR